MNIFTLTDETDLSDEHGYLAPIEGKIPRFLAWIGMIAGLAAKKKSHIAV